MPRFRNAAIVLALAFSAAAFAQEGSFLLEANAPQPYTAAYLGNGAISLVTTPLATEPAQSFLAGVYDHTAGDVPRIAAAPAWNEIDINNGSHWLNADTSFSGIEQYRQVLDMYDGVLRTEYVWNDAGKRIRMHVEQFVARDRAELAAVQLIIVPEFSGPLSVVLPLRNWPPPHRYALERIRTLDGEAKRNQWAIWYPGHLDTREWGLRRLPPRISLSVLAIAPGTGVKTGEAVAVEWTANAKIGTTESPSSAEATLSLNVQSGEGYVFTKYAAVVDSAGSPDVREAALRISESARSEGWDRLLSASSDAWHRLWDTDIRLDGGDPELQRAIHSMLFYLLGSVRPNLDISTGPMGLSSAGYYGHIFWDADTFMFPALVALHPELAKPMVAFRSRTLRAAQENAKKNGYKGAMYPWEAGPDGTEATPRFAFQNASSENHVNGDVALASWQYWLATGDKGWLQDACWPILRDTADFWASRVHYNPKRADYEIGNVVAVNESQIGVSNDPYTNAIAKKNLELAVAAAQALHLEPHPQWRTIAAQMYVPFSDSSLLWFPLGRSYSAEQTRGAIGTMLSRVQQHRQGAMMGTEFYPILAAQIHDRAAIGKLLIPLYNPYLRAPFDVIAETPRNQNTNFITGAGAFLQQFVFGYTGLRFGEGGLEQKLEPVLPPDIRQITLKNINVRGRRETLRFR
ncbi:MAG TPA: hypothetical protein VFB14_25410 [Bryobacteraceae bacterium]|nr:hypothetical protein [Bryobacteraceae bacterium]